MSANTSTNTGDAMRLQSGDRNEPGLKLARIGDMDIAYRLEGPADAPVVLLVHGVLTDHRAWNDVAERLTPKYRVLRHDLRGHGRSSAPPPPYTMEQLADDAVALLDELGIEQVHFIGSSLGGMIGQQLGARHGHRLLSLTLANTCAEQMAPRAWEERAALARQADTVAPLADATLQRWFTPAFIDQAPAELARMRSILCQTTVAGFAGCAHALSRLSQQALLQHIQVPTLVVVGNEDRATTPEQGQQLCDAIRCARLVSLPAAHQSAVEQPQAFAAAWLSFAAGLRA